MKYMDIIGKVCIVFIGNKYAYAQQILPDKSLRQI